MLLLDVKLAHNYTSFALDYNVIIPQNPIIVNRIIDRKSKFTITFSFVKTAIENSTFM